MLTHQVGTSKWVDSMRAPSRRAATPDSCHRSTLCLSPFTDLQKQVDEAQQSDAKTQDAMKELGKMISSAASTAPSLLRSAKKSLDDKQLELDELQAAHAALKIEAGTYKVSTVRQVLLLCPNACTDDGRAADLLRCR